MSGITNLRCRPVPLRQVVTVDACIRVGTSIPPTTWAAVLSQSAPARMYDAASPAVTVVPPGPLLRNAMYPWAPARGAIAALARQRAAATRFSSMLRFIMTSSVGGRHGGDGEGLALGQHAVGGGFQCGLECQVG